MKKLLQIFTALVVVITSLSAFAGNIIHWLGVGSAYDNNGDRHYAWYGSEDGINWAYFGPISGDFPLYKLAYGNEEWGAIGWPGSAKNLYTSVDGVNWISNPIKPEFPANPWMYNLTYANGRWMVAASGEIYTSTDGEHWQTIARPLIDILWDINYHDGQWVVAGTPNSFTRQGVLYTSTDGIQWQYRWINADNPTLYSAYYANQQWVAVGAYVNGGNSPGVIFHSHDGVTWEDVTPPNALSFIRVRYANGIWVAGGFSGIYSSRDGINWNHHPVENTKITDVVYSNGLWMAAGFGGLASNIYHSTDGETWASSSSPIGLPITSIATDGQGPTVLPPPIGSTVELTNDTSCVGNEMIGWTRTTAMTAYLFVNTDVNPQYSGISIAPGETVTHAPLGKSVQTTPNAAAILLGRTKSKVEGVTVGYSTETRGYIVQYVGSQNLPPAFMVMRADPCVSADNVKRK